MTWGGMMGFQSAPSTEIEITIPDLAWASTFAENGLDGLDGPNQGIMGVQHFERGLMWGQTYLSGMSDLSFP